MSSIKKFNSVHIAGFGGYIPYWRISVDQIGAHWGIDGARITNGLGVTQKAVASPDEDAVTMAVQASTIAIQRAGINPTQIGAVFVGSESHPYAVKPTGTILADILGIGNDYFCADLQFACKAGTAGLQIVAAMIEAGLIEYGLVVGTDKAQSKPGDALEYTAGAGAAAFILGKSPTDKQTPHTQSSDKQSSNTQEIFGITQKQENSPTPVMWAKLVHTYSYSSDTPDFWRRPKEQFPSHGGRFTGTPGYFGHVETCIQKFLKKTETKSSDFDYVILHMPNAKFPLKVAKKFGFSPEQINPSFLVPTIGNPYAASSPLGLVATLEHLHTAKQANTQNTKASSHLTNKPEITKTQKIVAQKTEKNILVISYGSGAGSDAFWFKAKPNSQTLSGKKISDYLTDYKTIDYLTYLKKWEAI